MGVRGVREIQIFFFFFFVACLFCHLKKYHFPCRDTKRCGWVMESEVAGDSCARALAALTSSRACGFASLSEFSVLEA